MFAEGDAASLSRIATWGPCSEELGLLDAATAGGTEAPAGLPAEAVVAFSVDAALPVGAEPAVGLVVPLAGLVAAVLAPGTAGADVAGLAGLVAAVAGLPVVPGAATLAPGAAAVVVPALVPGAVAAVVPVLEPGAVAAVVPVLEPGAVTAAPVPVVAEAVPAWRTIKRLSKG